MKTKIIAIEGPDGVGKTSLCNRLRSILKNEKITIIKTPFENFSSLTSMLSQADRPGRFASFLLVDKAIQHRFKDFDWVIVDRYILSTFVYHDDVIVDLKDNFAPILKDLTIQPASFTIYLEASDDILEDRLKVRKDLSNHKFSSKYLKSIFNKYLNDTKSNHYLGSIFRFPSENEEDQTLVINTIDTLINNWSLDKSVGIQ